MSLTELLVVAVVTLFVFGPNKLPMLAKHLGQLMGWIMELKSTSQELIEKSLQQHSLENNEQRAEKADAQYKEPFST